MSAEGRLRALRWAKRLGWLLASALLALYVGYPAVLAAVAVWPSRAASVATPAGFEDVVLHRDDDVRLAAWYLPTRNGAAIIVVHGAGESKASVRGRAEMLARRGFGVLALDVSGHGQSEGRTNRLAWQGTRDLKAAVRYLRAQPDVRRIGALGLSMGGEAVLGASAECPEIEAMVADGATRRCLSELRDLPSERPFVRSFTAGVFYTAVRLFAWQSPPAPLVGEMQRARGTRYLLIAAGDNDLETRFNRYFAQRLGDRAELWVVPGVEHVGAYSADPEAYEQRVTVFFGDAFSR